MDYSPLEELCKSFGCYYEYSRILAADTSMKIGGACDFYIRAENEQLLRSVVMLCRSLSVPYFILGKGSNLLVSGKGYRGCVIALSPKKDIIVQNDVITAWAGVSLKALCDAALENSLTGLEFAYGIPGSAGGALFMNAGAYGGEMCSVVKSCRYIDNDGEIREMKAEDMRLSYRSSIFSKEKYVITSVTLQLSHGDKAAIKSRMEELMSRRREKQPLEYPSCGSTFKRPEGCFAAALIEECGLKGFRIGGAMVSEKHSGFVINRDNAAFEDVIAVVNHVKQTVLEQKGILLECEMLILE